MAHMKASAVSLYFLHRDFDVAARPADNGSGERVAAPGVGGVSARNVSVVLQARGATRAARLTRSHAPRNPDVRG